ncbi:MAG: SDR family NAD(P)-dependent oxidoreductase, partial [Bacteroidota bacterium]
MEYKKIIVITGVSSGIGKELVKKLTGDTSNLVIGISRNNDRLETLRLELMHPENCQLIAGDISDPHDISDITVKLATHGRIDALIHNAGKLLRKPLE